MPKPKSFNSEMPRAAAAPVAQLKKTAMKRKGRKMSKGRSLSGRY